MANEIPIHLRLYGESQATRGMDDFAKSADRAGDKVTDLAKDSGMLSKKIAETKAEIDKLKKSFDETGDMDLLKSIRKERSNLRALEGLLPKPAEIAAEAAKVGTETGVALNQSLTKSLMASKGLIIPPLIAAALMAAPIMGAAISSAVVGAAGAGGLVGGIVAASKDQRVQDAAKQVGDRIGGSLVEAGAVFVGPLIESLNRLDDAGSRLADNFGKAGAKIAPVLPALASGVAGFADAVGPGFIRAMDSAKPLLRALASELPKIGDSVSDFFDKISDDPDQAVMGIVAISQAIQGTIDAAGSLLDTLGDIFEWSSRTGASLSSFWEGAFGWLPFAGDHIKNVGAGFREQVAAIDAANDSSKDYAGDGLGGIIRAEEEVKKVTKTATEAIEDQIKAMDKMFGRVADGQELASRYEESIDALAEAVAENGRTLDIGSEAGRANAAEMRERLDIIKQIRDRTIEQTNDTATANRVYDEQIEALRKQAEKLGLSKQKVDELIAAYKGLPSQVDVELRAPGLLDAIARMEHLRRLLGGVAAAARTNTVTINGQKYEGDTSGYGGGRAGGGPMEPNKWYTVGEQGPELVQMHGGGGATVYSSSQTSAMMSGASGGSSGGGGSWVATVSAKDGASQWLAEMIDVRVEWRMDQEATLVRGGVRD